MKITTTVTLTKEEVLRAITAHIQYLKRYDYKFPDGRASDFEIENNEDWVIFWEPEKITRAPVEQPTVNIADVPAEPPVMES